VVGSGRKNPVAIISAPSLRSFYEASEQEDAMDAFIDRVAKELAAAVEGLASSIRPGGVLLVLSAFSIANGELTANLKVRRRAVESRYDEELSALCSLLDGAGGVGAKSPPPKSSPLVRIRR
jgi:long-chain acyl-CoA synthetase